jgi:glucose-1-phosphate cytidylyltransferase
MSTWIGGRPMKTVILAGGHGLRLREETMFRPKPMVEIGGEPLLWHILKIYSTFGINDFLICLGYKGEMIKEYFLNYDVRKSDIRIHLGTQQREYLDVHHAERDWRVALVDTGQSTMTGGRLLRIRHLVGREPFMMTYGDGVANINIAKLLQCHQRAKRIATITAVRPLSRFGELKIKGSMVTEFNEKPQVGSGWINGGFFVFEPGLFRYLDGDDCTLERGPLERLASEDQLAVY